MASPSAWHLLIVALIIACDLCVHGARIVLEKVDNFENSDAMQTLPFARHSVILSTYDLECRCTQKCDKKHGWKFGKKHGWKFGVQSCEMVLSSSITESDKRPSCHPGETAYAEHCEALVQKVATQHDVRCDLSTPGVEFSELKTKLPQGVGKGVQTNKLTFDECVDEVVRRSVTDEVGFQKSVQMRMSSSAEIPINVGKLVINMPKCRCKKQWFVQALSREEASVEDWQGPGCSRSCKPRSDHRCVQPHLQELSNKKCGQTVKQYCKNSSSDGMCTQSWQCEHQGECPEEKRVQTQTKTASETEFLGQCHTCCVVSYPSGVKTQGLGQISCGSAPPSRKQWIKQGQPCQSGMSQSKSGYNGHGRCSWSGNAKVQDDEAKSSCSTYYGGWGHHEDDYYGDSDDDSDEC